MANKSVFATTLGRLLPRTDAVNREGSAAFAHDARHTLAQLAMTGTLNDGFYAQAQEQLGDALEACEGVSPEFLAKAAVFVRECGHMKDMPALMLAVLSRRDAVLFARTFPRVIDNGRMLRTFVQILRSGRTGRKSLGTRPKAMIAGWLNAASDRALLNASVGRDPSLADVIRMVHPRPRDAGREAFFAWLIGKPCDVALLPAAVRDWLRFRDDRTGSLPDVPFQMLTSVELTAAQWAEIARSAGWQALRMNLNTFHRHGVFAIDGMVKTVAARIADAEEIRKARVMPYQLMASLGALHADVPDPVRRALHTAMDHALANVPEFSGSVAVCPDVSGSMACPVTGWRKGASSTVRCVDVAALVAAAVKRKAQDCDVLPFEHRVRRISLDATDTVASNAAKLSAICGGGTNCSAPLAWLNARKRTPDLVILVSDNQSWVDGGEAARHGSTATLAEWERLKRRNAKAKLVCIDIAPYGTTQAKERDDILNIGGFSDAVFDTIAAFAKEETGADRWVGEIEGVKI